MPLGGGPMPKIVKGGDCGRDVVVRPGEVLSSRRRQLGDVALDAGGRDMDEDRQRRGAGKGRRSGRGGGLVSAASSGGRQASSRSRIAARKPAVQSWARTTPSS